MVDSRGESNPTKSDLFSCITVVNHDSCTAVVYDSFLPGSASLIVNTISIVSFSTSFYLLRHVLNEKFPMVK